MWSQNMFAPSLRTHSRSSSVDSAASFRLREPLVQVEPEGPSGNCSCKIFVLVYLAGCILVSAIYVVAYGKSQHIYFYTEEVWVPGTVSNPIPSRPKPEPLLFTDEPYTEWISQRWTYFNYNFSNWPVLPEYIDSIQQLAAGTVDGVSGVWILTNSKLYFAQNISALGSAQAQFLPISALLRLQVDGYSRIAAYEGRLFLFTPLNLTLLDCTPLAIEYCDVVATTSNTSNITAIYTLVIAEPNNTLWAGTDVGLFRITFSNDGELEVDQADAVEGPVQSLAWRPSLASPWSSQPRPFVYGSSAHGALPVKPRCSPKQQQHACEEPFGLLAVGTRRRVYFYDGSMWWFEWVSVWFNSKGGLVDGSPTSMTFVPTGELFISNNVSLTRVNTDYTFDRIGPLQGLPYNQINSLHFSGYTMAYPPVGGRVLNAADGGNGAGTVWVGTKKGYALYDVGAQTFRGYFFGPRWHSGQSILGFAGCCGEGVVVLSDQGISVVEPEEWTLQRKAAHYQAMLERHTRPPGLVADCPLTEYIPSTCSPQTTDNDGLWTSLLVVAESFRYHVTKDPQAQSNAWALFKGMKFLNDVTGIQGLMARSVVTTNDSVSGDDWHNSIAIPGWLWKGDTSSDEVVGHMFAYPLVHDLVAATQEQKDEVMGLVDNIVGYIKNNSYHLIDVTNRSTTWGVWAPQPLNLDLSWADQHGINALQILSYLLSAYRLTGKAEYLDAWKELFDNGTVRGDIPTHYGLNIVNQKITFPRDNNFSDDELAFLPYFVYFYSLKGVESKDRAPLEDMILASINRTWRYVRQERSSAWTAIYSYATGAKDLRLIEDLVWNLRTWPLELVEWETLNSHRLDITFNPEQDRNLQSNTQSVHVLPANERTQLRWNGNPYQLDSEGSSSETDPGAWLMPYWFARWLKLL